MTGSDGSTPEDDDDRTIIKPMPLPPLLDPEPATKGKLQPGTLINNNYEITEELKSGGMGEVYRGINIHGGPPVAIKAVLEAKADDNEAGVLFKREAMTLSTLYDDAIVRYYNYVHDRDLNRYFLVMEFIEGVPLKQHIAENGALSVEEVKALLRRVAGGLLKAHEKEIFHRDLSPDNIMLPGGRVQEARLIDFGIAKSNVVTEGTMHGRFAGKLKYVAPEQIGEFGGHISAATDIYGLGLLTCAAALGKPINMGSTLAEAVIKRREVIDLSGLDPELRPLLAHMLEFDPANRPSGMDAVQRFVDHPYEMPAIYRAGLPEAVAQSTRDLTEPGHGGTTTQTAQAPTQTTAITGLQMPGQTERFAQQERSETQTRTEPSEEFEEERSGRWVLRAISTVFLVLMGGVVFFAWSQGMIGGPEPQPQEPSAQAEDPAPSIPEPLVETRQGFLAAFETGDCTLVTRVAAGPFAGTLEAFSTTGAAFPGLAVAYEEAFGARPEILPRQISPQQCAVLDFVRNLQGRGRPGVQTYLDGDSFQSRAPVAATFNVPREQSLWVILIDARGRIALLNSRLSQPVGNRRTLGFGLFLPGEEPEPYLVLSVETDTALTQTFQARDGVQAFAILPLILEEIASRNGEASAALSFFELTPVGAGGEEEP